MKKKKFLKKFLIDRRGFTLIEAALTAGVLAVIALIVLELSLHAWRIPAFLSAETDAATEMRNAALWVERDLRRASAVSEAGPGNLSLTLTDGTEAAYVLSGSRLVRDAGGQQKTVARGLAAADFSQTERNGGVYVKATFTNANGSKAGTGVWIFTRKD